MLKIQNLSQLNLVSDPDILKLVTLRLVQLDSNLPTPMIIMECATGTQTDTLW
jgi:hypothetical protein